MFAKEASAEGDMSQAIRGWRKPVRIVYFRGTASLSAGLRRFFKLLSRYIQAS